MIRYIFIFTILWSVPLCSVSGQDSILHIYLQDSTVILDDQLCLSVRVNNFDSIEAFQLSINFDPYLLDFDSIGRLNSDIGLNSGFFGLQEKHLGIIRLTFFDPFESHSLHDSSVLFDLCFTAYGMPGELCPVNLADFPLPLEFISNEEVIPFTRRNARVDIVGGDSLRLIASTCKTGINDTTGSLFITVFGGNPPYSAIWQHTFNSNFSGGFGLDTFGQTMVINDLIEGRYRISIVDEDGIRVKDSLNLRKANDLVYSSEIIHPICDNIPEGAIIIDSLQGGIVPPQFKWSDGHLFSIERENLFVGDYFLSITDPLGCIQQDTFLLGANSIVASTLIQDETCLNSGDGSFEVSISGGQPFDSLGYEIIYDMDTAFSDFYTDSILEIGTYQLRVADSTGCVKIVDFEIGSGLSFGIEELVLDAVNCFGDSSASIFLRPSTLTGTEMLPYLFEWTGTDSAVVDSSSLLLSNLPAGSYSITVTNDFIQGCSWDTTITFHQPPFLVVQTESIIPASCSPDNDGQATLNVFGGTPDGDNNYLVLWDNGIDSITGINLSAGLHTALVIDLEGCQVLHEVEIFNTPPPTLIGSSIRDMRCDSIPTGSILTIFSSPFGIDKYIWSTGDSTSSLNGLPPGAYNCIVIDNNGCRDTFEFLAEGPPGPIISDLAIQNIQCFGDSNGRLDVLYDLGAGELDHIEWNGFTGSDSLLNLRSGGYRVIVYDENGCSDSAATTLVEPQELELFFQVMDDTNHLGLGSITAIAFGGARPYSFNWSPGTFPQDSMITGLLSGEYYLLMSDTLGCEIHDTIMVGFISGLYEGLLTHDLSLYPNPVGSHLLISQHHSEDAIGDRFKLFDMTGKLIKDEKIRFDNSPTRIDTQDLIPGSFLFTLWENGEMVGGRIFQKN